ncbi:hypothetical protein N8K70_03320 [Microbacterium betulae]|uniref:Sortase n=1 Tax=Microbacterium betulae TaxID=2981139 RepID=A0AA97FHL4_9MICO|nr:hypothetical protein [Microbacterium sp. AB]WOF23721.1 hypothetical protein N8K70_03320 [Microbacterium sp. AB]
MTARRRRLLRVSAASAVLLAAAGLSTAAEHGDAAFTDAEHARVELAAARLQPPQVQAISTCANPISALLGVPVLVFTWRWPASGAPYDAVDASDVAWQVNGSAATGVVTTGPNAAGLYTSTFDRGLLADVLGVVVSNYTVSLSTSVDYGGATWVSPGTTTVSSSSLLVLQSCSYANGS